MAAEQEARQQQFAQNGGQNGTNGQGGNGTGNREARDRDHRDQRPWRDDRIQDAGSGDQPDLPAVIDFADGENSGLVETPEAAVDTAPRREDRPRRNDRNDGRDRNRNRDDNRPGRGPRQTDAVTPEAGAAPDEKLQPVAPSEVTSETSSTVVAAPVVLDPVAAEASAPKAEASAPKAEAEAEAKPRRPRASRKPKEAGASDPAGGDPREAAE